ncbi:NAD(P)-dependent oxidoreductase [Kutzneria buriramensis]|uniref:3-hydroxyisobutyrate dehydrogenase-like beta-hydroxyacid dehydrogenase n=1 Tax=Kutzneria buriramensis TaxID=1045776 RepID=A0A3E0H4E4_9PSEU|nr:NAD(P)-dependent oxidoreductase [Kutzneria buriramensis]REH38097.1 3-hydroxyisobutyrate dehydrogenase-like beta-hydroxyacid dehydrogenase [Kutzneria buriramensis]
MTSTIAVLGTGAMGAGMAERLLDEGHRLRVWNRSTEKLSPLVERGAVAAGTPAEAARGADAVLVSLAHADAVTIVLFGPDGAAEALPAGALVLDTSTTSAESAQEIGDRAERAGLRFVEARVLGNPHHARSGQLRVLVGGPQAYVDAARPLLESIGKDVNVLGEWGSGAQMKIALNLFLGVQLAGLAEAVDIGAAAGLDRATVLNVLGGSGYSSPVVAFRCMLVNAGRLEPAAFRLDLMDKDLRLATDLATANGVDAPVTAASGELFRQGVADGLGHLDAVAVVRTSVPAVSS